MKHLTVTKLAEKLKADRNDVLNKLVELKLIYRKGKVWHLTIEGSNLDAKVVHMEKDGKQIEFITWPENFNPFEVNKTGKDSKPTKMEILNATKIGERYRVSNQRINNILAEIGWIEKTIKGWQLTLSGSRVGGIHKEHPSGGTYVVWPTSILENEIFNRSVKPFEDVSGVDLDSKSELIVESSHDKQGESPTTSYPKTKLKAKDGHMVASRGELLIDNMLYDAGIVHAYERELPIKELVKCDFYIPARNGGKAVYIEFWGIKDNEKYLKRKKIKKEIYKSEGYNLINIEPEHYKNLERYLIKELLEYDIRLE